MQKQASLLPFYEDFRGENTDWSIPLNSYHKTSRKFMKNSFAC